MKIKCIDAEQAFSCRHKVLTVGKKYEIINHETISNIDFVEIIDDNGMQTKWYKNRFEIKERRKPDLLCCVMLGLFLAFIIFVLIAFPDWLI